MPQEFEKTARVVVKNFDELVNVLKNNGKKFKGNQSAEELAKDTLYGKAGSGSLLFDYGTKIFGKKLGGKIRDGYSGVQHKITDFDVKAGNKIMNTLKKKNDSSRILASEKLKEFKNNKNNLTDKERRKQLKSILKIKNKGKFRSKLGEGFVFKHQFPLEESAKGTPDKILEVGVPSITAPLEKGKKVALPMAGALAINAQLTNLQSTGNEEQNRGDNKMSEKKSNTREELIEKISSKISGVTFIDGNKSTNSSLDIQKIASLTATASKMLKHAAEENKKMKAEVERLTNDNQRLASELLIREKGERGLKLATLMNDKKIIKKADIQSQAKRIAELDEDGYEMLKTAVESVNVKSEKDGVDNLTFLDGTYNINNIRDNKKPTLADSIEEAANGK